MTSTSREVSPYQPGNYKIDDLENDRPDFMVADSLRKYFRIMRSLLKHLDHEYWMQFAGFDGTFG